MNRDFIKNLFKIVLGILSFVIISCTPAIEETISTGGGKQTPKDIVAPKVKSIILTEIGGRKFQINIESDESAICYFSVNDTANEADTADKVVKGQNSVYFGNFNVEANVTKNQVVSSEFLTPEASYKFSLVLKDSSGNYSTVSIKDLTMQALDTVAPTFSKKELKARTTDSGTFETEINKNGKIYYIVVSKGSANPTSEQVKAGNDYSTATVIKKGSSEITKIYNFVVSGLTANTEYDLYLTCENSENPPTLSSVVEKIEFKTLVGNEQEWSDGKLPKIGTGTTDVTDTSVSAFMAVKKTGKIYGVILPKGANAPNSTQVMEGKDSSGTLLAANLRKNYTISDTMLNVYKYVQFTGLTPNTEYDVYCTSGSGASGNEGLIDPPYKLEVTTKEADMNPPVWSSEHPKFDTITENSFKFYVAQNKMGTIYVIVVPAGSQEPTIAQIKAQANYGSVTLTNKFTKAVNTIDYSYTQTISSLSPNTSYDVYSVGESSVGVLMSNFDKKTITTSLPAPATFQSISPTTGSTNISLNPTIVVTFTQNLDTTVKGTVVFNGLTISDSKITISGKTISIQLDNLQALTTYTGITLTGFKDIGNNSVSYSDSTYNFTTNDGVPPVTALVFANSDFENDVPVTLGSGFTQTRSSDYKKEGNNGIRINGTMGGSNGNFYTVTALCNSKGSYTKISFWLKVNVTSTKGMVIRLGNTSSNYYNVNDDTISSQINITTSPAYVDKTLSERDWIKVTLDISTIDNIDSLQFIIRGGSTTAYDICIDHVVFE